MKRFVIQEHTRGGSIHWDLMIECGDILKTWKLSKPSGLNVNEPMPAQKSFDHDLKFLTYEGPVNNGEGLVHIVDAGTFETIEKTEKRIHLRFEGKILIGDFVLEHIEQDMWVFSIFNIQ